MKKISCALLFLCLPLLLGAQAHKGLKAVKALNSGALENTVTRSLPQRMWPRPHQTQTTFALLSQATPRVSYPRLHDKIVLAPTERSAWIADYQQILADFEKLKKESSTFLFYQSIPLERRYLSSEETRQWLDKLIPLYDRISAFYLTTQQDVALKYALDYVSNALSVIDPYVLPALQLNAKPLFEHFNAQQFFLYPPQDTPLQDPSVALDGKNISLINDDSSLLMEFEKLSHFGVLFPGAAIHTNGSPILFLLWFQNVSPKPDIVFTDIQLGQANGYYIAHELRRNGYTGGIIALTSYAETEDNARQLKAAGFDGMVSLDERYWKVPFAQRVTQAAQVYLERNATK